MGLNEPTQLTNLVSRIVKILTNQGLWLARANSSKPKPVMSQSL